MIFTFSGTGNSRYVAQRIARITGDSVTDINDKIKNKDFSPVDCGERIVFVTPTYGWRIPRVVEEWISRTEFRGSPRTWFVMTCGGEIGGAAKYNKELCKRKNLTYMGTAPVVMPENYIAMFDAPGWEEAEEIIGAAEPCADQAGQRIRSGQPFPAPRNNLYDRAMSDVVNPVFYAFFIKAGPFTAGDACTGCGECVRQCPLNNISLVNGKPGWGKECTHCMACISHCPVKAIEYGKASRGKPRYTCQKKVTDHVL